MYLQRASPHVLRLRLNFPKARHHIKILLFLFNLIRPLLDFAVVLWLCLMDIGRCRPAFEAHLVLFPAIRVHEVLLLLLLFFLAEEELVSVDLADAWPESL